MSLDLFSINMWPHRGNKKHSTSFWQCLRCFSVFFSKLVGTFPAMHIPSSGAYQLGSTKPSLYPWEWGIDKPSGIRWDRFLVLSGISVVRFSKHLWRGLLSHPWTTVFHDLLANLQLFHADWSLLSNIDSLQQWSWIHHITTQPVISCKLVKAHPRHLWVLLLKLFKTKNIF